MAWLLGYSQPSLWEWPKHPCAKRSRSANPNLTFGIAGGRAVDLARCFKKIQDISYGFFNSPALILLLSPSHKKKLEINLNQIPEQPSRRFSLSYICTIKFYIIRLNERPVLKLYMIPLQCLKYWIPNKRS